MSDETAARVARSSYPEPDPNAFSSYQRDIYTQFRNPTISTKPSEWEALAKKKVPAANYGYVYGAASSGDTHAANLAAFKRYKLKPRMLVNATRRDLSIELFGKHDMSRACKKRQKELCLGSAIYANYSAFQDVPSVEPYNCSADMTR